MPSLQLPARSRAIALVVLAIGSAAAALTLAAVGSPSSHAAVTLPVTFRAAQSVGEGRDPQSGR
jgi:hypothetical protein